MKGSIQIIKHSLKMINKHSRKSFYVNCQFFKRSKLAKLYDCKLPSLKSIISDQQQLRYVLINSINIYLYQAFRLLL